MITIRAGATVDMDRLYELLGQFVWSTTPDRRAFEANYPAILADPSVLLRVAEDDGVVLGYSLAVLQWTLYANGQILVLQELMVDPQKQRHGIGTQLMAALIEDAKASGAKEITVPTRRAKEYYPRFGFTEIAGYFKLKL